ncbi:hypothetical protein RUM43_010694, partial [Polyplax serrata]
GGKRQRKINLRNKGNERLHNLGFDDFPSFIREPNETGMKGRRRKGQDEKKVFGLGKGKRTRSMFSEDVKSTNGKDFVQTDQLTKCQIRISANNVDRKSCGFYGGL